MIKPVFRLRKFKKFSDILRFFALYQDIRSQYERTFMTPILSIFFLHNDGHWTFAYTTCF